MYKWDAISLQQQLDVLVYDMIVGGHWVTLQSWRDQKNTEDLQRELAKKKQIWDQNKLLSVEQKAYIVNSTFYVSHDHKALSMRNFLLTMLNNKQLST
jgi:hypothetical protein